MVAAAGQAWQASGCDRQIGPEGVRSQGRRCWHGRVEFAEAGLGGNTRALIRPRDIFLIAARSGPSGQRLKT
jgi:hypothetical protein